MSERARNFVAAVVLVAMAATLAVLVATAPTEVDRVQSIGERIKCPVCQGESIANSPAEMARDMMDLVSDRVAAGSTDEAIVAELLDSFSGAVLLDPPVRGSTLVLWLAPVAALAIGAIVIWAWKRQPPAGVPEDKDRRRILLPLIILGGALAVIVGLASFFLQERDGPASGVADLSGQDLDDVSNETMEAVIAANVDNPQVDGMRLALAERYFEIGDYRSAFPQYLDVAESPNATDPQAVTALVRLGWMAWDGNAEAEAAIGLFDQALAIDDSSSTAMYLKGQVIWCGTGDADTAADLFEAVLANPDLPAESRALVQDDLEAASSGVGCT